MDVILLPRAFVRGQAEGIVVLADLLVSFAEEEAAGGICPQKRKRGRQGEIDHGPAGRDGQAPALFLKAEPVLQAARFKLDGHILAYPEIPDLVSVAVDPERHAQVFLPVHKGAGHLQVNHGVGLSLPVEFEVKVHPLDSFIEHDLLAALGLDEFSLSDHRLQEFAVLFDSNRCGIIRGAPDFARRLDRFACALVIGILEEAPVGNLQAKAGPKEFEHSELEFERPRRSGEPSREFHIELLIVKAFDEAAVLGELYPIELVFN